MREGERARKHHREQRAHEGDESENRRDESPQRSIRNTNPKQPQPDDDPKASIDRGLMGQEATDPLTGLVQGTRRQGDVPAPDQANESISKIFALDEKEDHQHQDDDRSCERLHHRGERALDSFQRRGLGGNHADGSRSLVGGDLLVQVANDACRRSSTGQRGHCPRCPAKRRPSSDGIRVLGHLRRKIDQLAFEQIAETGDGAERHEDDHGHRQATPEHPLEALDRGTEREGHDDRQRQRNQNRLRAREDGDDQREGREPKKRRPPLARRRHGRGWR